MITNANNYLSNMELRTANISPMSYNRTLNTNGINQLSSEGNISDILLPTAIYITIRSVYILFVLLCW
jgi:hypothetical protein